MLKNYITIAWRNITRNKVYAIINILGLAFGICSCLVIFLITRYEFSFDRFHPDNGRIYRIVGQMTNSSGEERFFNSPVGDAAAFQKQIPGFEAQSGFHFFGENVTIPVGNKESKKFGGRLDGTYTPASIITGPDFFDIFKYEWLAGNPSVLKEPYKVVLAESSARKYFGDLPAGKMIGKTVIYADSLNVSVAGIVKDWDKNSDFGYTDFISISTATHSFLKDQIPTEDWSSLSPHRSQAFVKLSNGVTAAHVNAQFADYIQKQVKPGPPGSKLQFWLQPLQDIHFTNEFHRGDDGDDFRKPYLPTLYALMGVAIFILLIASVNFINLSTAQSVQRAKEVGIRKVLGSRRASLIIQFLAETFMLTMAAVILSLLLVRPMLLLFHDYIPPGISFSLNGGTIVFLLSVTVITTILAGFYPAKVLSSYLPALSLKGTALYKAGKGMNLRKALIIFQFSISLIFIIGSLVISNQIRYMRTADKGFNSDAVVSMWVRGDHSGKLKTLVGELKHVATVDKAIIQGTDPMGFARQSVNVTYKEKENDAREVGLIAGDENFIPFYQMKILAGRNLLPSDSMKEMLVNETYARILGFNNPQDILGKVLTENDKPYPVVGVVADFHEGSFHESIQPTIIAHVPDREESVAIKLATKGKQGGEAKAMLAQVEKVWKKVFPDRSFDYRFQNETIARLYEQESNTSWLVNTAMLITIFISCMGLFGLGMFTAEKRTKEIGIRKVLGASVTNIATMLNKDFVVLVLISILIASPVAWYLMNQWLQDFAYRTDISWWVFVVAGLSAIFIALLTVSFHAIKAAITNPVKSLRTE